MLENMWGVHSSGYRLVKIYRTPAVETDFTIFGDFRKISLQNWSTYLDVSPRLDESYQILDRKSREFLIYNR